MAEWPGPGELVVSPRFLEELERSDLLQAWAAGRVVGTIGEPGLRSPDELVVYQGLQLEELGEQARAIAGYGGRFPMNIELQESQVQGLAGFFLACLGLPICALLMVATRLSATIRTRRFAALRLLGVSARQTARVNAVEQMVVGLSAGVVALLLYPPVNYFVAGSGVLSVTWFPQATSTGPLGASTLLLGSVALSWFLGARVAADAIRAPWTQRRWIPEERVRWWQLLPLAVGVAGLWWQFWRGYFHGDDGNESSMTNAPVMIFFVFLTGIGMLLGAGVLTAVVGRWWRKSHRVTRRIGGARAAFNAISSGKLAAGVMVLVFAVGVGIGHSRDARATSELNPDDPAVFSVSLEKLTNRQLSQALEVPDASAVALAAGGFGESSSLLFTDCRGLRFVSGMKLDKCDLRSGSGYRVSEIKAGEPMIIDNLSSGRTEFAAPKSTLTPRGSLVPRIDSPLGGYDAVLPISAPGARQAADQLVLVPDEQNIDEMMAKLLAIAPYSQPSVYGENPAQAEINSMLGAYIRFAFVLGGLVALMALVVALLDRAVQRRRVNARMLAQGMRPGQLRAVQAWEAAASMVPQVALAWLLGIVGAMTWQYTGGLIRTPDWVAFGWLTLGTLVAVATAVTIAAFSTPRRVEPQLLRAE
ncbi:hypothetical protein JGS22_004315 [Streptomyces sp. P38-E01]|uniref:ABC3 transporter permease C-terminal domain-containing protein n=1 Tax=Streptomyces tardus TaxID=2780544 RepID=A0A949JB99_9ACTN|nr:FtsX-like permease family protein [Streptomyces tardus]MBU7596882.1 hypothetical protein [Streptomyces tardus]